MIQHVNANQSSPARNEMKLEDVCRVIRERMKLSQKELACLVGSTQTEMSFIERGFIPRDGTKVTKIYLLARSCMYSE